MDGDEGGLKLKARVVLHVHRDSDKNIISKDYVEVDMAVVKKPSSISACLRFVIGTADIRGAYIKSVQITREVFL